MTSCGLWAARRGLVAVVVNEEGRASPALLAERTDDARWGLLEQVDGLHGLDCELVLSEELAKADPIGLLALERGLAVWTAPWQLVQAIRAAAALATGPPARSAAMIARLAVLPAWRGCLRPLRPPSDRRQLQLL